MPTKHMPKFWTKQLTSKSQRHILLAKSLSLQDAGIKLLHEGHRKRVAGIRLQARGIEMRNRGHDVQAFGYTVRMRDDQWEKGNRFEAEGITLRDEGSRLIYEANRLLDVGVMLRHKGGSMLGLGAVYRDDAVRMLWCRYWHSPWLKASQVINQQKGNHA
jgi:hypothetical protein